MLIGDTHAAAPAQPRLEDAEITALPTMFGGYCSAAPAAAVAPFADFARLPTQKSMAQARLMWDRFTQLRQLARVLRMSPARAAAPFAGGMSKSLRETNDANTDLVQPRFRTGMIDSPSTLEGASTS